MNEPQQLQIPHWRTTFSNGEAEAVAVAIEGEHVSQGPVVAEFERQLAAKFLNLYELRELVYCVIDDNPHKLGLRMPGSGLQVRPSSVLIDEKIDLCLLSLSPESEKKVIAAKQAYVNQGGQFCSIFTLSPIAFQAVTI